MLKHVLCIVLISIAAGSALAALSRRVEACRRSSCDRGEPTYALADGGCWCRERPR